MAPNIPPYIILVYYKSEQADLCLLIRLSVRKKSFTGKLELTYSELFYSAVKD